MRARPMVFESLFIYSFYKEKKIKGGIIFNEHNTGRIQLLISIMPNHIMLTQIGEV